MAESDDGPRANAAMSQKDRDSYPNLILLCPTHHTLIDASEAVWTVEKLHKVKQRHEAMIAPKLNTASQLVDVAWATIVDEFAQRIDLVSWADNFSGLAQAYQGIRQSILSDLYDTAAWLNSRIYPSGHHEIARALETMQAILVDLLDTFDKYAEVADPSATDLFIVTPKFYKRGPYPNPHYHEQAELYGEQLNLVADLTLELTRCANWFCDVVRNELDQLFMVETGALQLLGGPYGLFDLDRARHAVSACGVGARGL